ncbi:hypothetical protein F4604DRAFT_1932969 [Suillus subluteus]|nr:hypothetical protein F4604DRAFT_1932969 [Suillus subluteus]
MSETTCCSCNSKYSIPADARAARKVKDDHSKQCPFAVKNCKGFPVPFVDGKFCCPFRYNGCLFSAKIDPVRKHQCTFGPVQGHTPQTIYGDAASLRPVDLGQYIETNYADILRSAKKAADTPSSMRLAKIPSCQTQVNALGAQPAAVSSTSGEDAGEIERTSTQDNAPQEMWSKDNTTTPAPAPAPAPAPESAPAPAPTLLTTMTTTSAATTTTAMTMMPTLTTAPMATLLHHCNVKAGSEHRLQHGMGVDSSFPSRRQCAGDNEMDGSPLYGAYDLDLPGDSEGSESNQEPALQQRATLPSSSIFSSGISTEIPILQVDGDDPLCHVVQVLELAGMSLMTSFQPDLKLFVCERCRFAVWADHLTGHVFNNHRSLLPPSVKQSLVDAAVTRARDRLQAAQPHQLKVVLPQRLLPPLPWLREPVQGYRCYHCPYVAASSGTILIHSKRTHPGKEHTASKHDQCVLVQLLFSKAQYFVVHAMLQSIGPDHLFAKFYSTLLAQYIDGAFIDGDMSKTSDPGDLSPFLTTAGWAQATEGYSMPGVRAMSNSKVEIPDIHYLARIEGLGKRYHSTISSTSDIEPTLLDALTSWRARYCPFQILQEKDSVETYGLHCDRLVMMILRAVSSQSASIEGTVGSSDIVDGDAKEEVDDDGEDDDGMLPSQDWGDMDFVDEVDEDTLWPEGDPTVEEEDPEDVQIQRAKTLRECCTDPGSSKAWLMDAYHSVVLSVFTTNTNHDLHGPLDSLIDSFIMSTSIDMQGRFVPPHLISSHLAKLIYAAMFSILTEVMKSSDPYQ